MATIDDAATQAMQSRPNICISSNAGYPEAFVDEFIEALEATGLPVARRSHGNLFAGVEWLMPTAVVVFIADKLFGTIISEATKDLYNRLKGATAKVAQNASTLSISRVSTSGKLDAAQTYSPGFSVVVSTGDDLVFKLLVQPGLSSAQTDEALGAFFDLMFAFFSGTVEPDVLSRLEQTCVMGHTLLVAYDFGARAIFGVDPLPDQRDGR